MVRIRKFDQGPANIPEKLPEKHTLDIDSKKMFVLPDHVSHNQHSTFTDPTAMLLGKKCPASVRVSIYTVLARDIF
jgi:hypothetical protein